MKRLFCIVLILGSMISYTVMAQKKYSFTPKDTMEMKYETFDINQYKSKMNEWGNLSYTFTKEDGTVVHISASNQREIDVIETPPAPYFYINYKIFYPSGKLKEKGQTAMKGCPIGEWLECDEEGNCKIVNYEKNRGKFTYEDVLKFMDKKKHIDLKTGRGRDRLTIGFNYEDQRWGVTATENGILYYNYTIDSNTGKVLNEKTFVTP